MNKILYKFTLHNFAIAFLICIIIFHIFPKSREGFDISDISKISGDVQNISRVANSLPTKIGDLNKTVDAKFQSFGEEVKKQTLDIVTVKLESVFIQIGDILNDGLVKPMLVLFKGIGEIFIQIFNILKMIAYKIISLPDCIMPYAINETGNVINARRNIQSSNNKAFRKIYSGPVHRNRAGNRRGYGGEKGEAGDSARA